MKKLLTICTIALFAISSYAQNPNFDWANSINGTGSDWAESITTDASGNVYVTGSFQGTVDFDPGPATYNLTSNGFYDVFVQKQDASGNLLWAKSMGATGDDRGHSVTTDALGNAYITGYFEDTVDFDPGIGTTYLTSNGSYDIFIQKLDASGNLLWAKSIGGPRSDRGWSVATDALGNLNITGYYQDTVDFDPGIGTSYLISTPGFPIVVFMKDIFILKLDASGNLLWAKSVGGIGTDESRSIASDGSGVYVTGYFNKSADFDPGIGTHILTTNGSDYDIFVLKLDHSGNFLWAIDVGSDNDDGGWSTTMDFAGNVLVTGYFSGTVDFDPGTGTFNLNSTGGRDIFVLKLDASGNFLWAKSMGGGQNDQEFGRDIATDATGNVYVTGYFQGTVDFDPGSGTYNLSSNGSNEIFILKLDASGNFIWANAVGSASDDRGYSIATYASVNIYVTGIFGGTVDFDPGPGIFNLSSGRVFVLKLSECPAGTDIINACEPYTWIDGITYTSSNNTATYTPVGCASPVTLDLTIVIPDVSVTNASPLLTANATGAGYQWLDCNNNFSAIAGETNASFTATANGDYAVEINQNGCVDTSGCYTIANVCNWTVIDNNDFESGWGIWNDGGSNAQRSINDAAYANSGSYCIRLRDNTNTSVMFTDALDLSAYNEVRVDLSYYVRGFGGVEDFWLQLSSDGGSTFSTVKAWTHGIDFNNDQREFSVVSIFGPFSSNSVLQFRCDASSKKDQLYIDDVLITACNTATVSYTLNTSIIGSGSVAPASGTFNAGTSVTLTATPAGGWQFDAWSGDISGSVNPYTFVITSDIIVTATFSLVPSPHILTTYIFGDGTVTPASGSFSDGSSVTLTANPDPGWRFDAWSGDITGSVNPVTFIINSNTSVTATFSEITTTYTLTTSTIGLGAVAPASGTFNAGSSLTLTASPDPGWQFDGWSGDISGTVNPVTFIINSNTSLTATFSPSGSCTWSSIDNNDFEAGWGIWNDGGSDAQRISDPAWAYSGTYCIKLRDNTSSSVMTTDAMDWSAYEEIKVDFTYIVRSFEGYEDFWLQISNDGGNTYSTQATWQWNTNFQNNERMFESINIYGPFSSNSQLRFRCDAGANNDMVYIDDVFISGCSTPVARHQPQTIVEQIRNNNTNAVTEGLSSMQKLNVSLFPNPAQNHLTVVYELAEDMPIQLKCTDVYGQLIYLKQFAGRAGEQSFEINTGKWSAGYYVLTVTTTNASISRKFVVIR